MTQRLYIRPIVWSEKFELKGYTSDGQSVYIRIPKYTTHILTFPTVITPDIVRNITRLLDPLKIQIHENQITVRSLEKNLSTPDDIQTKSDSSLNALFISSEIDPYQWIAVDRYKPLITTSDCDLNLSVSEIDLHPYSFDIDALINPMLAFWFPHFADDCQLKAIGIRTVRSQNVNSYLITADSNLHPPDGMIIVRTDSVDKMWNQGLQLLRLFRPDYIIGWDHGTYPDMSTEYIDLKSYFRRFYPYFHDYRLNILSDRFIPTSERTPFGSVRQMHELWNELSIWNRLTNSSNRLRTPITLAHNVSFPTPSFFQGATPGIYHDVFVYDYTNLYRKIMTQSSDPKVRQAGKRLKYAPSDLVLNTFYAQPSHLESRLNHLIKQLKKKYRLISILHTTIKSSQPIVVDAINLVDMYSCYICLDVSSHIILNHTGHTDIVGLCQPPFELITDAIRQYIYLIDVDAVDQFQYPDVKLSPIRKLTLRSTIWQIDSVVTGSIPFNLIKQYSGEMEYPLTIPYIMTTDGPIIASKFNISHTIDANYYVSEMRESIQQLHQLKNYRGISQTGGCKNDVWLR